MLNVQHLNVQYQNASRQALSDISFEGSPGELIIIAGSSGSGKSTLANALIGLIPHFIPSKVEGEIFYDGKTLKNIPRKNLISRLGYVPQYPADFTISMLVEEEVAFPLENLGIESNEANKKINHILSQLGISHLQKKLITELSSGELQKVAIAVALVHNPLLLILDEPMARIDPRSEINISNILREIADKGRLVLVFEHRLDYLFPLADRVIFLENGEIIANGNPKDILKQDIGVDLPEVSEIQIPNKNIRFLTLNEAKSYLTSYFGDL